MYSLLIPFRLDTKGQGPRFSQAFKLQITAEVMAIADNSTSSAAKLDSKVKEICLASGNEYSCVEGNDTFLPKLSAQDIWNFCQKWAANFMPSQPGESVHADTGVQFIPTLCDSQSDPSMTSDAIMFSCGHELSCSQFMHLITDHCVSSTQSSKLGFGDFDQTSVVHGYYDEDRVKQQKIIVCPECLQRSLQLL